MNKIKVIVVITFAIMGFSMFGQNLFNTSAHNQTNSESKTQNVSINFQAVVGKKPFNCAEIYEGIGSTNSKVKFTDVRFYVSNVRLVDRNGKETPVILTNDGKWQNEKVALIAFENGEGSCQPDVINVKIKGNAASGDYVGLDYTIGVPLPENHADQTLAPSPLNLSEMGWSWNAGYKFIRLEMNTTGKPNGYVLHLGSTNCKPAKENDLTTMQCGFPNRPEVSFDKFDWQKDVVTVDLKALYDGVNVDTNQEKTAVGCMSSQQDSDCGGVFNNLGLPFGDVKAATQNFMRVGKRTPNDEKKSAKSVSQNSDIYRWDLPKGFPTPRVPVDNPMTTAKVELGRYLFYDKKLSVNQTTSCATCHLQERAFTDGRAQAIGATGETHPRGSMSLANIAYTSTLNWANPSMTSLERQPLVPLFGEHPIEMGMAGKEKELIERLKSEPRYEKLFMDAYPNESDIINLSNTTKSIASFVCTLISGNSPYDQYKFQGKNDAVSDSAKRGEELFFSEKLECFDCHAGFNLSGSIDYSGKTFPEKNFQNNGLYNLDKKGLYPAENTGVFEITSNPKDMGKFKVPTLRNIELTAPYMHDGSISTLEEVIEHYKAGGRTIKDGKFAGNGSESPLKSNLVRGFDLTEAEKKDLVAFFRSLTDTEFITNPKFSNPWNN